MVKRMIEEIASKRSNNKEDGDYFENGFLMCGKCHTRKQCEISIDNEKLIVPCLCKCEDEKQKAEELERKLSKKKKLAFSGESYMKEWTFENDKGYSPKLISQAKNYCKKFGMFLKDGKGLLLYGNTGRGKTFTACCIANELIKQGYSVKVANLSDLANEIFNAQDKTEYMQRFLRYDLFIIDDFGVERDTAYMNEIVYSIVDTRYRSGKPMIITTNLTSEQLKHPKDIEQQRVFSRIKERCIPIEVKGEDIRVEIAKEQVRQDLALLDD